MCLKCMLFIINITTEYVLNQIKQGMTLNVLFAYLIYMSLMFHSVS